MAGDVSFDVVSDFDEQELRNALDQVRREAGQRFDFKGVTVDISQGKDEKQYVVASLLDRCAYCSVRCPRQSRRLSADTFAEQGRLIQAADSYKKALDFPGVRSRACRLRLCLAEAALLRGEKGNSVLNWL